jgi:hypothetical protein
MHSSTVTGPRTTLANKSLEPSKPPGDPSLAGLDRAPSQLKLKALGRNLETQ